MSKKTKNESTTSDSAVGLSELLAQKYNSSEDLACWFGLSYASFLTLPRVLMFAMPEEWQKKMALLLNEFDNEFPNTPDVGYRVQIIDTNGKLIPTPDWMINYRHPYYDFIERFRR